MIALRSLLHDHLHRQLNREYDISGVFSKDMLGVNDIFEPIANGSCYDFSGLINREIIGAL